MPSEEFMPYKKLLAGASLVLLAFAAVPAAYAANDGDSSNAPSQARPSPTARPHHSMDPAQRAARKAKRQARRLARQQQMQGAAPN